MNNPPQWLLWAREIQALAQTGLEYAENQYQVDRNRRLTEISAEIVIKHSTLPDTEILNFYFDQKGYATPKVDVRAAVFREEKILLVEEARDGGWCMPGGWADVGDEPSQAAERETWEEAGLEVKAVKLIGVYDANRTAELILSHAYKLVFLCEILSGEPRGSFETSNVRFFAIDEIPQQFSGQRTSMRHILDAFDAYHHPETQTIFD
ncbi:MAG: NUDIX hydrolase N-terminal domain-containing protein [Anaerolineales bacterium]|nr:NUDIX hydrolase N-terminal domain-containing protein [Anaerolineales bacterium]